MILVPGRPKKPHRRRDMKMRAFHNMKLIGLIVSVTMLGGLAGCTSYRFEVNPVQYFAAGSAMSFRLVEADPLRNEIDPLVLLAKQQVATALSSKGLFEAPANVSPDMIIEVDFGIDPPNKRQRYERDLWVPANPNNPSGSSNKLPTEHLVYYNTYPKHLRVSAREATAGVAGTPPKELWSVYVTNEDESKDLELYLPLMVSVAMDALGTTTTAPQTVRITDHDRRVEFVRRGMP